MTGDERVILFAMRKAAKELSTIKRIRWTVNRKEGK